MLLYFMFYVFMPLGFYDFMFLCFYDCMLYAFMILCFYAYMFYADIYIYIYIYIYVLQLLTPFLHLVDTFLQQFDNLLTTSRQLV